MNIARILLLSVPLLSACSTTPGDAALRAGHPSVAADLYQQGTEHGDALAARKLGLLIHAGSVSTDPYGDAGMWFVLACELGDLVGCHNAGVGYEYGKENPSNLPLDYSEAVKYYRIAAEGGYMQSQYNLGSMYANRYFSDDVTGLAWLLAAQAQARKCVPAGLCEWILEDPPGHIVKLRSRMSQLDQAEAEARVRELVPSGR